MSTPERTDDPGKHGYGAAEKDSENLIGDEPATSDEDAPEANPSRRHRRYGLDADRRPTD